MKGFVRFVFLAVLAAFLGLPSGVTKPVSGAPHALEGAFSRSELRLADVQATLRSAEAALRREEPSAALRLLRGISSRSVTLYPGTPLVREAAAMWNKAEVGDFSIAASAAKADVVIVWQRDLLYEGQEIAGFTTWTRDDGGFKATVQVRTHLPGGKRFTLAQQRHTMMHELGHVLGLADVSDSKTLMGPLDLRKPVSKACDHEVQELRDLQNEIEGLRERALQGLAEQTADFRRS